MLAYAIRHAESQLNTERDAGLNAGLTNLGNRQAEALGVRLKNAPLRAIYSSPFTRCIKTARPLAQALNLPVRLRPELCEHHHLPAGTPADTGLAPVERIAARYSEVIPCPDHPPPFDWAPADETMGRLIQRMRSLAKHLKARWTGEEDAVVLISHGSPIARLIDAWLTDAPGPPFRFIIDNGAICALRHYKSVSSLVCLNEASHLRGLPIPEAANYRPDGSIKPGPAGNYGTA